MAELHFKGGTLGVYPNNFRNKFTEAEMARYKSCRAVIMNGITSSGLTETEIMEIITLANIPHELEMAMMMKLGLMQGWVLAGGKVEDLFNKFQDLIR